MMQCFLTVGHWGKGEQLPFLHPGMTGVVSSAGKGGNRKGEPSAVQAQAGTRLLWMWFGCSITTMSSWVQLRWSQIPKQHPKPRRAPPFELGWFVVVRGRVASCVLSCLWSYHILLWLRLCRVIKHGQAALGLFIKATWEELPGAQTFPKLCW